MSEGDSMDGDAIKTSTSFHIYVYIATSSTTIASDTSAPILISAGLNKWASMYSMQSIGVDVSQVVRQQQHFPCDFCD